MATTPFAQAAPPTSNWQLKGNHVRKRDRPLIEQLLYYVQRRNISSWPNQVLVTLRCDGAVEVAGDYNTHFTPRRYDFKSSYESLPQDWERAINSTYYADRVPDTSFASSHAGNNARIMRSVLRAQERLFTVRPGGQLYMFAVPRDSVDYFALETADDNRLYRLTVVGPRMYNQLPGLEILRPLRPCETPVARLVVQPAAGFAPSNAELQSACWRLACNMPGVAVVLRDFRHHCFTEHTFQSPATNMHKHLAEFGIAQPSRNVLPPQVHSADLTLLNGRQQVMIANLSFGYVLSENERSGNVDQLETGEHVSSKERERLRQAVRGAIGEAVLQIVARHCGHNTPADAQLAPTAMVLRLLIPEDLHPSTNLTQRVRHAVGQIVRLQLRRALAQDERLCMRLENMLGAQRFLDTSMPPASTSPSQQS